MKYLSVGSGTFIKIDKCDRIVFETRSITHSNSDLDFVKNTVTVHWENAQGEENLKEFVISTEDAPDGRFEKFRKLNDSRIKICGAFKDFLEDPKQVLFDTVLYSFLTEREQGEKNEKRT